MKPLTIVTSEKNTGIRDINYRVLFSLFPYYTHCLKLKQRDCILNPCTSHLFSNYHSPTGTQAPLISLLTSLLHPF